MATARSTKSVSDSDKLMFKRPQPDRVKQLKLRIVRDNVYGWRKKIKMEGKELDRLPVELFSLSDLEVLEASPERMSCLDFHMMELPIEIGRLVNLKVLILDTNRLRELPPEIQYLTMIERIMISNNMICDLPPEFANLVSLKSLHLANNQIKEFPLEICCLENLEFLDLSSNRIKRIPVEIQLLTKVSTLNLMFNKISRLPMEFCKMKSLRTLWLGKNRIQKLPKFFGRLSNLDWGQYYKSANIEGNPLTEPPIEVCIQGPIAIRKYFGDKGKDWGHTSIANDYDSIEEIDSEDNQDDIQIVYNEMANN